MNRHKDQQSKPHHYALAALAALGAAVARGLLGVAFGDMTPYLTFFPAVVLVALYGGFRAGIFATFASAVLADFFFIDVPYSFKIRHHTHDAVALFLFVLNGTVITYVADHLRRTRIDAAATALSEERFRIMADGMPHIVWSANATGSIDYYNQRACDYAGVSLDDISSLELSSFIHPEDAAGVADATRSSLETGRDFEIELRLRRFDGAYRWHLCRSVPVRDQRGRIARWIGSATDIEDQKQAFERLRLSEERFRIALRDSPITVSTMDRDFRFTWVYNTRHGFTPDQVIGKRPDELIAPEDAADLMGLLRHVRDTGRADQREVSGRTDGTEWHYYDIAEPVFDKHDEIVGITLVQIDIAERKRTEAALTRLNTELSDKLREVSTLTREQEAFIYSVSHDLREPLRSIASFSGLLSLQYSEKLDGKASDYLFRIAAGAGRMNAIIEDLLDLSRISRQELDRRTVDMSALAAAVIADLKEAAPGRMVTVNIQPEITAAADPGLTHIVLTNLLHNAWKFTAGTGQACIELGTSDRSGKTVYHVKDNGAGFDASLSAKLFQPFQRLHADSEFEGTGIGLAIVERIVRRHGGTIWAEGKRNQGASFFFTLN